MKSSGPESENFGDRDTAPAAKGSGFEVAGVRRLITKGMKISLLSLSSRPKGRTAVQTHPVLSYAAYAGFPGRGSQSTHTIIF